MRLLVVTAVVFFVSNWALNARAQTGGSTSGDTFYASHADSTKNSSLKTKSPKSAVIRAVVFPGLGQFYNEQYIKAGIVLIGQSVLVGLSIYYNNLASESMTPEGQEFYKDRRNLMYWLMGAGTLLSMLDAYIDAQLFDFDTGPELGLRVGLLGEVAAGSEPRLGLSLRAKF